ncbi:MAG TPA: hypothetical protein VN841_16035 [Bryobacteraceae bacterium]|nr:hypothetical protein [Bryobacteraceae bacterium]
MTPLVIVWFVIGLATAGLALYRKLLSMREEDLIHLGPGEESLIPQQSALAHKLDVIDVWGKGLTVATVAIGLVIAAIYLYNAWLQNQQPFH